MIIEGNVKASIHRQETHQAVKIDDRKRLQLTGVEDVAAFSEHMVMAETNMGRVLIRGEKLHIAKIDIEGGELAVDGVINSLEYLKKSGKKGGFFERLFR